MYKIKANFPPKSFYFLNANYILADIWPRTHSFFLWFSYFTISDQIETRLHHANELNTRSKSTGTGNMGLDLCSVDNLPHVRHLMAPAAQ